MGLVKKIKTREKAKTKQADKKLKKNSDFVNILKEKKNYKTRYQ
jgi:hypothetical protein